MGNKQEIILPSYSPDNDLANKFSDFFTRKTATARDIIINNDLSMSAISNLQASILTHFRPATQDEVCVVIMKSSSKSCEVNPLPMNLLKVEESARISALFDLQGYKQITC